MSAVVATPTVAATGTTVAAATGTTVAATPTVAATTTVATDRERELERQLQVERDRKKELEKERDGYKYDRDGYRYDRDGRRYDRDGYRYDDDGYRYDRDGRRYDRYRNDNDATVGTAVGFVMFFLILVWIWFIAGLLAFITSLVCFGFNGSVSDKFLGLATALTIGPFYWFYFIFNKRYCTIRPLE
jgi:hypothetical protein